MLPISSQATKYWEDVKENEQLPEIVMPVTLTLCVRDAAGTRDFFPGHHDRDFAQGQGVRNVYVNTMFLQGFVDRVGSQWAGPGAWLLRRRLDMVASICVGDTMTTEAQVVGKYEEDGRHLVDINVRVNTEHGLGARAALTFILPSRGQS